MGKRGINLDNDMKAIRVKYLSNKRRPHLRIIDSKALGRKMPKRVAQDKRVATLMAASALLPGVNIFVQPMPAAIGDVADEVGVLASSPSISSAPAQKPIVNQ